MVHSFTHEAMKTVFQLRLSAQNARLARCASLDCFQRLDSIEESLSRHFPGSDVWQINHMESGESLFVGEDCYQCLRLAMLAGQATGGLFDVTLGRLIEHQKSSTKGGPPELEGQFIIDETHPKVHCTESGRQIDLGGIGKGYALDVLAEICREWGIRAGILSAGASTHLAFGREPWEVLLRGDRHRHTLPVQGSALSASGTGIQCNHIVNPSSRKDPCPPKRAWVRTRSAAIADAFSTAALLATEPAALKQTDLQIEIFSESDEGIHPI
jgi:thiamine biosynthesis lipoprotein